MAQLNTTYSLDLSEPNSDTPKMAASNSHTAQEALRGYSNRIIVREEP